MYKLRWPSMFLIMILAISAYTSVSTTYGNDNLLHDAPIYEGDALLLDAEQYAKHYEVELDEAIHRLKIQKSLDGLSSELATREKGTFAGLWLQHVPDFRVIVQLTQGNKEVIQPYSKDKPYSDYIEVHQANATLEELKISEELVYDLLREISFPADSLINIAENHVELRVLDHSQLDAALRNNNLQLPDHVVVVTVDALFSPASEIFGGLRISASNGNCTTGFSVMHASGDKGITTAAHCQPSLIYNQVNLPVQNSQFWGPYDVQWAKASHMFTVRNLVFDGTWHRYVYATKHRNNQNQGDWVCKYGRATGQTCGHIQSTSARPIGGEAPPMATATYVLVNASGAWGDSGGPVFAGNTAYGTIVFTASGGSFLYMAANYISDLGVVILTN